MKVVLIKGDYYMALNIDIGNCAELCTVYVLQINFNLDWNAGLERQEWLLNIPSALPAPL